MEAGAIPPLIALLSDKHVSHDALILNIWILANIAGDSVERANLCVRDS